MAHAQKGSQNAMTRSTNVKTRVIQRMLRRAGFVLWRNAGGHEIWRKGIDWVRVAAGHRNLGANELCSVLRTIERARQREMRGTSSA